MSNPPSHAGRKTRTANRPKVSATKGAISGAGEPHNAVISRPRTEITAEERHRRISEAAYYRALRRGFHGGADLEDWLESEAKIDKLILHS